MGWLYFLPLWGLCVLFVVVYSGLVSGGTWLVRRLGWTLNPEDIATAGVVHSFIGTVYAVALALTVVFVEEGYKAVEQAVDDEVMALADVYRNLSGIESSAAGKLQADLRRYVDSVIEEEWPSLRRDIRSPETREIISKIDHDLIMYESQDAREQALFALLMSDMDRLRDARHRRVFLGRQGISSVFWMIIVIGALITLGFCCFLPVSRLRVHLAMNVAMASLFAMIIALIFSMDRPLRGEFSVPPDEFETAREMMRVDEIFRQ